MAARTETAVGAGAKAVLKAVARLHPDEALEVLGGIPARGVRGRVLLAARIALMRKALQVPARVVAAEAMAEPEVVAAPVPVQEPVVPKPLAAGRITSVNLDNLSAMFAAPEEPEPAVAPDEAPEGFAALDWADVAGTVGDGSGEAEAGEKGRARGRKRGAVVAIREGGGGAAVPEVVETRALFAGMEAGGAVDPEEGTAAGPLADAAALFAAMEEGAGDGSEGERRAEG